MFEQLMESEPRRVRRVPQTIASIAIHTVIIAISIQLTRAVAESAKKPVPETPMLLTRPPAPSIAHVTASAGQVVSAAPAALALPSAPIAVPVGLPPVETGPAFDPRRFGLDHGNRSDPATPPDGVAGDPGAAITQAMADDPAEYLDGPKPVYPPALRQVGVTGAVTLRYVVGVDGKVEPATMAVIDSSNASFAAAAIQAILGARFRPARLHGRSVRQLVEQVIRFTLDQ
jgi:periplasmic protein TonB